MRSTENTPTPAQRFGALVAEAAAKAGYDIAPGSGGRVALARATGMSQSAIGRMLDGKTLPRPSQFEAIARAVGLDVRTLLVEAEVISSGAWTDPATKGVRSAFISPEEAADAWGITDPTLRKVLEADVSRLTRLQAEIDTTGERGATARG